MGTIGSRVAKRRWSWLSLRTEHHELLSHGYQTAKRYVLDRGTPGGEQWKWSLNGAQSRI